MLFEDMEELYHAKSTFHYGSIKIKYVYLLTLRKFLSTFHYGSIKIYEDSIDKLTEYASTFHYGSIKIINCL